MVLSLGHSIVFSKFVISIIEYSHSDHSQAQEVQILYDEHVNFGDNQNETLAWNETIKLIGFHFSQNKLL